MGGGEDETALWESRNLHENALTFFDLLNTIMRKKVKADEGNDSLSVDENRYWSQIGAWSKNIWINILNNKEATRRMGGHERHPAGLNQAMVMSKYEHIPDTLINLDDDGWVTQATKPRPLER